MAAFNKMTGIFRRYPREVAPDVKVFMQTVIEDIFTQEGPGWQQLAPRTVRTRKRLGFGPEHPILQRTGSLKESITKQGIIIGSIGPNRRITTGSADFRFPILHAGAVKANIPARPMLPVGQAAEDTLARLEQTVLVPKLEGMF
jgi:phage gpG-like protein